MPRIARHALVFSCLALSIYALAAYTLLPVGAAVQPEMRHAFETRAVALRVHVFAAIFALALGPFQFSAALRAARPRLHRIMGRLYLGVGVLVGGSAGLYVAQEAYGGALAQAGFSLLAMAWLYTGWRAFSAIRAGDVARHRAWMLRNFALTLAAVTLRIYLPLSMLAAVPWASAYAAIAWLCWVPNVLAIEWWLRRYRLRCMASKRSTEKPRITLPPARMSGTPLPPSSLNRRLPSVDFSTSISVKRMPLAVK